MEENEVDGMEPLVDLTFDAAVETDIGLCRDNNEDNFWMAPEIGVFAVLDGMGGMAAGETASAEAVRALQCYLAGGRIREALNRGVKAVEKLQCDALTYAHERIAARVVENPDLSGMACTVVLAILAYGTLHTANLGDSRAYVFRGNNTELLTQDHSVAAALTAIGELTSEEARDHILRNQLTAAIGCPIFREPSYAHFQLKPGDRVVICTDGLWDCVSDESIRDIAGSNEDAKRIARSLIEAANGNGGPDNITVLVLRVIALNGSRPELEDVTLSGL